MGAGANHTWMKLWYRGKDVLKKSLIEHIKKKIKKASEAVTQILDCASKCCIERS